MTAFLDSISISLADSSDIKEIQAIDVAAGKLFDPLGLIDEGPDGQSPIPETALVAGVSDGLLWTAIYDGQIVGFLLCRKVSPDLYLEQVSVRPDFGRRGIGRLLVAKAIHAADDLRLRGVILSTFRDVPWNGPFYADFGFTEIDRSQLKPWMLELEKLQAESMDISLRCFMRRPGRWAKNWLRLPQGDKNSTQKPVAASQKT